MLNFSQQAGLERGKPPPESLHLHVPYSFSCLASDHGIVNFQKLLSEDEVDYKAKESDGRVGGKGNSTNKLLD